MFNYFIILLNKYFVKTLNANLSPPILWYFF